MYIWHVEICSLILLTKRGDILKWAHCMWKWQSYLCQWESSEVSSNFLRHNTISLWWFKFVSSLLSVLSLLTLHNSRNFMKEDSEIHFFIKFSHCSKFFYNSFKQLTFKGFNLEIKFLLQIWSLSFLTTITKLNESMPKEILLK